MASKKTKYLSYIEETRKHHSMINDVAKKSSSIAISNSHKNSVSVTYVEEGKIVKVNAKGSKKVLGKVEHPSRKVKVGTKTQLSQK